MWAKLGIGKTVFEEKYRFHAPDTNCPECHGTGRDPDADNPSGRCDACGGTNPYVPDTQQRVKRVKAIPLGVRNIAFLEHEGDELIDGLAKLRDAAKAGGHSESKAHERKVARKAKAGARTTQHFLTDALPRKLLDPELSAQIKELERKLEQLKR